MNQEQELKAKPSRSVLHQTGYFKAVIETLKSEAATNIIYCILRELSLLSSLSIYVYLPHTRHHCRQRIDQVNRSLKYQLLFPTDIYLLVKSTTDGFAFLFTTQNWNLWNWVIYVTNIVTLIALTYLNLENSILSFCNTCGSYIYKPLLNLNCEHYLNIFWPLTICKALFLV